MSPNMPNMPNMPPPPPNMSQHMPSSPIVSRSPNDRYNDQRNYDYNNNIMRTKNNSSSSSIPSNSTRHSHQKRYVSMPQQMTNNRMTNSINNEHQNRSSSRSSNSSLLSMNRRDNYSYDDNDSLQYDSFVGKSSQNHSPKRLSPRKNYESFHEKADIYSSASILSDEISSKRSLKNSNNDGIIDAKIPIIDVDNELNDDLESMNLSNNNKYNNLINQLILFEDDQINVHNEKIYKIFENLTNSNDLISIEQLGATLYDPYKSQTRFTFKSLEIIIKTFASSSLNYELDLRCFVKMCKFVKGCYTSFNYHDKRGNDHVLDFEEFQKALKSNKINCPDYLLAKIFENSESIDLENYITAIILIRKNEKKH